jgi:transcriptional regulator with XRE-family HTH domain
MPGANDLIHIPDSLWQRPETTAALRNRDIGRFFALLRQYAGASQTQIAIACGLTQGKVSDIMRAVQQVEKLDVFERIAGGLALPDPARVCLGLAPRTALSASQTPAIASRDITAALEQSPGSALLDLKHAATQEDDPVRRRAFVGLTGATVLGTMLDAIPRPSTAVDAESLAQVLTGHPSDFVSAESPPSIAALTAEATAARRHYQACRYSELTSELAVLLAKLHTACASLDGQDRLRAYVLSADAHHVAAGLLLKLDDKGLASLAADRSMHAAIASQDPVTVGASARIITHTLMNGHHLAAAISTATTHAARLDRDVVTHTPDSLSVYGSLLLRGAVAAAQHDDRDTAYQLLGEANHAARRLGVDGNRRWTAFGPLNTQMHRVSIAVTLGDAGTAVDVARRIDLNTITVTERKASLLIDTARAYLQWGRHENAYLALRAAEQTAHEEVAGRPRYTRLVRDLVTTAPPSIRRDAEQFATQIGVNR